MFHAFLIVDDSATTRAFIRRTIKMTGFADAVFFEAADGLEGLDVLAREQIDLVVADLHMPKMDGEQMTRRMLADEKLRAIPVLIASADPNSARREALLKEGARGYVRKPFTPEAFRDAMNNIVGAINA